MATKAELEAQLAEAQAQLAVAKRPDFKEINIEVAQEILGIRLASIARTKDKKIQSIQNDLRNLTIAMATALMKSSGDFVVPEKGNLVAAAEEVKA